MLIGATALATQKLVSTRGGLQLPRTMAGYGNPCIRTGALSYPREAIDSDNFTVSIAKPVKHVVSQAMPTDEYLYSVVRAESVVGVSASAYQPGSSVYDYVEKHHPAIATDPEIVLRLNPDLILVSSSARADLTSLMRSTGVPVFRVFTMVTNLDQVADTIRLTGYLTGEDEAAHEEEAQFRSVIKQAQLQRSPGSPKPRILGLSGRIGYGDETLFNDIVEKLGGINVGAEGGLKGYGEVSSETILGWTPSGSLLEPIRVKLAQCVLSCLPTQASPTRRRRDADTF